MDFIDKQYIALFERSEQSGQVSGFFEHRATCHADLPSQLMCNDVREGGFSQTGRAMQEDMVERFVTRTGCLDKYFQIFDDLILPGKFADLLRAQYFLQLLLGPAQLLFVRI